MAAVMSFPFYKDVLKLQQSDSVNIHHWVLNVKCCITLALRELRACSVVPGEKSEGDRPEVGSGARWVPAGAQLNKTKH